MTGIRIEATKEVTSDGKVGFRISSIAALPQDKLPAMYLDNNEKPIVYLDSVGDLALRNRNEGTFWMMCNSFYTTKEMEKRLAHIREAGQYLTQTNAHLRKEREAWNGHVKFVDGIAIGNNKTVPSENPEEISIPLAERIAKLWGEEKLLYQDKKGHIKPLKPLA